MKPKGRYLLIFLILSVGLFVLILLSLALGAEPIPVQHSLAILASVLGLDAGTAYSFNEAYTLLEIRLPRALMAVLVGATLATAGTALQGLFRNPLAEPALIGISGGGYTGCRAGHSGGRGPGPGCQHLIGAGLAGAPGCFWHRYGL
ncbi:MAG: iron chelate uptake ABC transporter family permease subunit [Sphingobacteriia bacterium]